MHREQGKILVIRFGSLGDLVLLTSLLDALAESFPGSEIHLVTKDIYSGLFGEGSGVDVLHTLPTDAGLLSLLVLRRRLARERFDVIIDAHNVLRSNLVYHTLRAPAKVQLPKHHMRKLSLIGAGLDLFRGDVTSMRDMYLGLSVKIGAPPTYPATRITPGRVALESSAKLMEEAGLTGRTVVALAPGARWETKRWPAEHFHALVQELERLGYGVLIVGEGSERELCGGIADGTGAVDLSGKLSLEELAAALSGVSILVTNDSAPLHVAEAVGTPVVALFGPTVRQFGYYPLLAESVVLEKALDCRPCSRNGSGPCRIEKRECLEDIPPSEVLDSVLRVAPVKTGGS